jgi:hypothetical protein
MIALAKSETLTLLMVCEKGVKCRTIDEEDLDDILIEISLYPWERPNEVQVLVEETRELYSLNADIDPIENIMCLYWRKSK